MSVKRRILLIGGPGSGKTTLIQAIEDAGYEVYHEISRQITLDAQKKGIEQLFLEDPLAFSNALLKARVEQFKNAKEGIQFYDRGIPDIPAYHIYTGDFIPEQYLKASKEYTYDNVFFLPPWEEIYESDNERYETYKQAVEIGNTLVDFYGSIGYHVEHVPKASLEKRLQFILTVAGID